MLRRIRSKTSLRFKQWSRKSYAAFKSIGRQVSIGRLKGVVADALLGKQKNGLPELNGISTFNNKTGSESFHEPPDGELQIQMLLIPVVKQEKIYCETGDHSLAIKNIIWLKAFIHRAFSLFYSPPLEGRLLRCAEKTGWFTSRFLQNKQTN